MRHISPPLASTVDIRRWINVGLKLAHRLRRWTNVKPTLLQRLVSAGSQPYNDEYILVYPWNPIRPHTQIQFTRYSNTQRPARGHGNFFLRTKDENFWVGAESTAGDRWSAESNNSGETDESVDKTVTDTYLLIDSCKPLVKFTPREIDISSDHPIPPGIPHHN